MFFKTINAFPDMNPAVDLELMYVDQATLLLTTLQRVRSAKV